MIAIQTIDSGPLWFDGVLDRIIKGLRQLWAGIVPNEGEDQILDFYLNKTATDRGTNHELGLFTNTSIAETITEATITEPTGGSYARKTLADGSWSQGVQGRWDYAVQQFAPDGAYSASVYGYFIATTGTTPRCVVAEVDAAGPYDFVADDTYDVTPRITAE